jgi:hypothetical protein
MKTDTDFLLDNYDSFIDEVLLDQSPRFWAEALTTSLPLKQKFVEWRVRLEEEEYREEQLKQWEQQQYEDDLLPRGFDHGDFVR